MNFVHSGHFRGAGSSDENGAVSDYPLFPPHFTPLSRHFTPLSLYSTPFYSTFTPFYPTFTLFPLHFTPLFPLFLLHLTLLSVQIVRRQSHGAGLWVSRYHQWLSGSGSSCGWGCGWGCGSGSGSSVSGADRRWVTVPVLETPDGVRYIYVECSRYMLNPRSGVPRGDIL